jgi:hypothetical protein
MRHCEKVIVWALQLGNCGEPPLHTTCAVLAQEREASYEARHRDGTCASAVMQFISQSGGSVQPDVPAIRMHTVVQIAPPPEGTSEVVGDRLPPPWAEHAASTNTKTHAIDRGVFMGRVG